jgi:hypothetical protein
MPRLLAAPPEDQGQHRPRARRLDSPEPARAFGEPHERPPRVGTPAQARRRLRPVAGPHRRGRPYAFNLFLARPSPLAGGCPAPAPWREYRCRSRPWPCWCSSCRLGALWADAGLETSPDSAGNGSASVPRGSAQADTPLPVAGSTGIIQLLKPSPKIAIFY